MFFERNLNMCDAEWVTNGLPFSLWEKGWDEGLGRLFNAQNRLREMNSRPANSSLAQG